MITPQIDDHLRSRIRDHVADVGPIHDDDRPDTAETLLAHLCTSAWHSLDAGVRDGRWTIGAENALDTIIRCMRILGPTSIEAVPLPAIARGLYDAVLHAAGLRAPDDPYRVVEVADNAARYMIEQRVTRRAPTVHRP